MHDDSPYADAGSGGVAPLLATPLNVDGGGIAAAQELERELAGVTTVAKSEGHLVAGLSFDDDHLDRRRRTLGASEIPAVVGLDPYRSALDIYLQKRGLVQISYESSAQEWGLRLEDVIAQKYADLHPGSLITRAEPRCADHSPWMSATPDRYVANPMGDVRLLEIKNKSARQLPKWGESGTDQVPFEIIAQATWQMLVTNLKQCDVAVLFGGNEFRLYHLRYDHDVANRIYDDGRAFWFDHVVAELPPDVDGSKAAGEYLKRRFAQLTDVVREATKKEADWMRDLSVLIGHEKKLGADRALLENKIKQAIGDDAGLMSRQGRISWKAPQPTTVVDHKAIHESLRSYVPAEVYGNTLRAHTAQRPNSRRFLCNFANTD